MVELGCPEAKELGQGAKQGVGSRLQSKDEDQMEATKLGAWRGQWCPWMRQFPLLRAGQGVRTTPNDRSSLGAGRAPETSRASQS